MQKNKTRNTSGNTAEQDIPAEVNDTSAEVSEDAACCVADIDAVLADVDEVLPAESEEEQGRREYWDMVRTYMDDELSEAEFDRQFRVWQAQYGHLGIKLCGC